MALGLTLTLAGLGVRPSVFVPGTIVLALAGLAAFARANGYRLAHAGYTPIVSQGCWDVPLAFALRRGARAFLFRRSFDVATGELSESYAVYALPPSASEEMAPYLGFRTEGLGAPLGHLPAAALRFERDQVARDDLDAGLAALGAIATPGAGTAT
jgi:hypothetical protein